MPVEQGSGGGGVPDMRANLGGTCWIGGADEAAWRSSITQRLQQLESQMALVLSGNVSASQLSDISQQVGWVTGVTYMGLPGWTRTEYGTLIPPDGFVLSLPGLLPGGAQLSGVITSRSAALQSTGVVASSVAGPDLITSTMEIYDDSSGLTTLVNDGDNFRVTVAGWYLLTMSASFNSTSTTTGQMQLRWGVPDSSDSAPEFSGHVFGPYINVNLYNTGGASFTGQVNTASKVMWLDPASLQGISFFIPTGTTATCGTVWATLNLLKTTLPSSE